MLTDASIYDDNMTLLQAYKNLAKRVKALEESGGGGGGSYVLPTASASVKGGVKIGSGLQMDGEVLSATGGGGGGSVSFSWENGEADGEDSGLNNPPDGFILGWGTGITLPLVEQYTEQITATNIEDETDTKTFYLPNNSLPYFENIARNYFNFNIYDKHEPLKLIPLTTERRYQNTLISTPSYENRYLIYPLDTSFLVFDSEDQSGEVDGEARYSAQILSQEVEAVGYVNLGVTGLFPSIHPTLNGAITEMNITDMTEEKTYHWEGSISYADIYDAYAWHFIYQYLKAQTA